MQKNSIYVTLILALTTIGLVPRIIHNFSVGNIFWYDIIGIIACIGLVGIIVRDIKKYGKTTNQ